MNNISLLLGRLKSFPLVFFKCARIWHETTPSNRLLYPGGLDPPQKCSVKVSLFLSLIDRLNTKTQKMEEKILNQVKKLNYL